MWKREATDFDVKLRHRLWQCTVAQLDDLGWAAPFSRLRRILPFIKAALAPYVPCVTPSSQELYQHLTVNRLILGSRNQPSICPTQFQPSSSSSSPSSVSQSQPGPPSKHDYWIFSYSPSAEYHAAFANSIFQVLQLVSRWWQDAGRIYLSIFV